VSNSPRRPLSSRYLSEDERVMIGDLRLGGATLRVIGAELGRSPSTVSRELRRNLDPKSEQYRAFAAHRLAAARRSRPGARRVDKDAELGAFVLALLRNGG
jgi:IS30 family transposase